MDEICPETLEEVEDCIARIRDFQKMQGRKIHKAIKKTRGQTQEIIQLEEFGVRLPKDYRALYYNYNGTKTATMLSMWETAVFLQFHWYPVHMIEAANKIRRLEKNISPANRLHVFSSTDGRVLELDTSKDESGKIPLVMTLGPLSRNDYIAFDSTLSMLRSVCAAQDAGVIRYAEERVTAEEYGTVQILREEGEVYYDVAELWDVIKPFNSGADYWVHLIEGTVDWDEREVNLPENGIIKLDPEVKRLISEPVVEQQKNDKAE